MNIQAKVALDKQKHPEKFCPASGCLWRLFSANYPGGYKPCQKHPWLMFGVKRMEQQP